MCMYVRIYIYTLNNSALNSVNTPPLPRDMQGHIAIWDLTKLVIATK